MKTSGSIIFTTCALLALVGTISCRGGSGSGGNGGGGGGRGGGSGRGFGRSRAAKTLAAGAVGGVAGAVIAHAATKSAGKLGGREVSIPEKDGIVLIPGNGINLPLYSHPQEVRSYYKSEGPSMSAFGIIALILGLIGTGSLAWFCYTVGLPMWRERNRRHSSLLEEPVRRTHEGIPLQETPSTATPSP